MPRESPRQARDGAVLLLPGTYPARAQCNLEGTSRALAEREKLFREGIERVELPALTPVQAAFGPSEPILRMILLSLRVLGLELRSPRPIFGCDRITE